MSSFRTAYVYVREEYAAKLCETDYGYSFAYDKDYISKEKATSVSLTLPIREEEYTSSILFPFFDGLIPEGWLLEVVTKNWKVKYPGWIRK